MTFYGIPGREDVEAVSGLDDMRGDGIDVGSQGHGANRGDLNEHESQRLNSGLPPTKPCKFGCCRCVNTCRCCNKVLSDTNCNYKDCNKFIPKSVAAELTGDRCCGQCSLNGDIGCPHFEGDIGCPHFEGDLLGGCDVFAIDDEPSVFAAEFFGGDETMAGEWAENMLAADVFSEDELYALGWDPFKAAKKAIKPLTKTVKAAVKKVEKSASKVGKVTSKIAKVVGKVPVVGKLAESGLRTAGKIGVASLRLNPVALLSNPKKALKAQITAAKGIVGTAKQSLNVAKQLVKSPVVRTVAAGAAIVFPPVGVPAAAALATVAAVAGAIDSKVPAARAAALKVVENTTKLARAGDKGAQIALSEIATQKKALTADKLLTPPEGSKRIAFDVSSEGNVSQVQL